MAEKKQLKRIVWYFQMDGFFSLSPSFKWTTPTWFMHDIEKTASITERITVVLAIPYTTTMGGRAIIHILAHITGKLGCISL